MTFAPSACAAPRRPQVGHPPIRSLLLGTREVDTSVIRPRGARQAGRISAKRRSNSTKLASALAGVLCFPLLAGSQCVDQSAGPPPEPVRPPFAKVLIVVLENENESEAIDQPFLKSLA